MSARWAPGSCYAVVAGHGAALLDEDLGAGVAEALLVLLSTPEGSAQALDAIVGARGGRVSALPSFALVLRGQEEDRVLVRGTLRALVDGHELGADPASPWAERRVPTGYAVVLEGPEAQGLGPGTEYLPLLGGVVRAGGLGLAAGSLPRSTDGALGPDPREEPAVPVGPVGPLAPVVPGPGTPTGPGGAQDDGAQERGAQGDGDGATRGEDAVVPLDAPSAVTADGDMDLREELPEAPGATISWSPEDEAIASGLALVADDAPAHGADADGAGGAPAAPAAPAAGRPVPDATDPAVPTTDPASRSAVPATDPASCRDDVTEPLATAAHDAVGNPSGAATPDDGVDRLPTGPEAAAASRLARVIETDAVGTTTGLASSSRDVPSLLSLVCANGHANPPDALSCSRCPAPLVPPVQVVAQPVLARLAVSTGELVDLLGEVVIGRAPRRPDPAVPSRLVAVPSPGHLVSRSHLIISTQGWSVLATDLGSNNGTVLVRAGTEPVLLGRRLPTPLVMGDLLDLGEGVTVRLVPPA